MSDETSSRDPSLETRLTRALDGGRFGRPLYAFARVASTMDVAHRLAADGAPEGALVWAARQEQGRGRLGREWSSPAGGAYFSLILRPSRPPAEVPQLALVTGLAVAEAIWQVMDVAPSIRWPNDLLIDGRKVAGILVEAKSSSSIQHPASSTQSHVVAGVGINVTTDPHELPDTAISLASLNSKLSAKGGSASGGKTRNPKLAYELTAAVCRRLQFWYDTWTAQGFAPIRSELRSWIGMFGQPVHVASGAERVEGTAADLDEAGRLLVRLDAGMLRAFDMGEVTLLR